MHRSSVLFPDPLGPTTTSTSPRRTSSSTPRSTWKSPNHLLTRLSRRAGSIPRLSGWPPRLACRAGGRHARRVIHVLGPHDHLTRVTSERLAPRCRYTDGLGRPDQTAGVPENRGDMEDHV